MKHNACFCTLHRAAACASSILNLNTARPGSSGGMRRRRVRMWRGGRAGCGVAAGPDAAGRRGGCGVAAGRMLDREAVACCTRDARTGRRRDARDPRLWCACVPRRPVLGGPPQLSERDAQAKAYLPPLCRREEVRWRGGAC